MPEVTGENLSLPYKASFPQHDNAERGAHHEEGEEKHDKNEHGIVSLAALSETLHQHNLTLTGGRTPLSGGFFGPLYELETAEGVPVVEVCFTVGGDVNNIKNAKSYLVIGNDHPSFENVRARLRVVNPKTSEIDKVAIDWVYNDEQALKNLQGIEGIPHFYGAAREQTKGSILMEKVEGYDLLDVTEHADAREIEEIFDKILETYVQTAELGYLYAKPEGGTIMVDAKTKQPYLTDWYDHRYGSLNDPVFFQKYEEGLEAFERRRGATLVQYYEKEFKEV